MAEFETSESWKTTVRLAAAVGRLRVASNLKAVADAQQAAFMAAGEAAGAVAEAATRDRGGQVGRFRDAAGALARCRSWIEVVAELTNEPVAVFDQEIEMIEHANKLIAASLSTLDTRDSRPPRPDSRGPRDGAPRDGGRRDDPRPREDFRPRGGGGGRGKGTSQPGGLR
ncbi:MAG: hypothetical protein R3C29_10035 [Dehalococcoidia bacterium]|nr:hypothetical protein [Dehalococcoidia bacterium]MCA9843691.1 hypothetical protein [Dehalococcoidia bacterium]